MKISMKAVAFAALAASTVSGAPVEMLRHDAATDLIVDLGLNREVDINQMSLDYTGANPYAPSTSSSDIQAKLLAIPGIDLPITSVRQHVTLIDNGVQLGQFETPWSPASVQGGVLKTSLTSSALNMLSTSPSRAVTLKGTVDAKLDLGALGTPTISGIGFKVTTTLAGLNNLQDIRFKVAIDHTYNRPSVVMTSIIDINNPSKLSVTLGDITLDTATSMGHVGTSAIKEMTLVPGPNTIITTTNLNMTLPSTAAFLNELPYEDQELFLSGFYGTSTNPVLNAALHGVTSKIPVPKTLGSLSRVP
ncbi:hypothetical protein BGZ73_004301 [Actinomortierella ambigua]|nr:hypothetical protein BGZ73_004301 [Actinomortierella ambigua]